MDTYKMTSKEFFRSIQIIHFALMSGVIMLGIFSFYFHYSGLEMEDGKELNSGLIYVVPVFAIAGIVASNLVFKQKLNDCRAKSILKDKMTNYRSALIIKFALIEGCSFFALIAYLLTGNLIYLGFAGLLLIVLITYWPSKEKTIIDLELTHSEQQQIYDPVAIIG